MRFSYYEVKRGSFVIGRFKFSKDAGEFFIKAASDGGGFNSWEIDIECNIIQLPTDIINDRYRSRDNFWGDFREDEKVYRAQKYQEAVDKMKARQ